MDGETAKLVAIVASSMMAMVTTGLGLFILYVERQDPSSWRMYLRGLRVSAAIATSLWLAIFVWGIT